MPHISLFDRSTLKYSRDVEIADIIKMIKAEALASEIGYLRKLSVKEYKSKKATLPSVTWSGTFDGSHKASALLNHSGYICIDFDNLKNVQKTLSKVRNYQHTLFAFVSPSGSGIKVIVPVSPIPQSAEEHRDAYNRVKSKYEDVTDVEVDKSGSDVSRLCFLSSDSNAYFNSSALAVLWNTPLHADLASALDFLEPETYADWFLVGTALYNTFPQIQTSDAPLTQSVSSAAIADFYSNLEEEAPHGNIAEIENAGINQEPDLSETLLDSDLIEYAIPASKGLHMWDNWSRRSDKYEDGVCEAKWTTFENNNDGNQIGSIFYIAEQYGWERDNLEYDVEGMQPDGESLSTIFKNEQIAVRRNLRTAAIEFNHVDTDWMFQFGKNLLPEASSFAEEKVWIPEDDFIDIDLRSMIQRKYKVGKNKSLIYNKDKWTDATLFLASKNPVDPFREWLEKLPTWDGKERLRSIWYTLGADRHRLNEETAKRMMVGAVRRTYEPGSVHDWMPVLIGEQGTGKSSVVKALLPENKNWFSDAPSLLSSPKEQIEAIGSAVIVEYPEITGLYRKDVNMVKSHLSRTTDRLRMAYRRNSETIPRKWVAVGTANDDGTGNVLPPDATGSRRFVAIQVEGTFDIRQVIGEITNNREQLWAEAIHLFRRDYPNTLEELVEVSEAINQEYMPGNDILREHLEKLHNENGIDGKRLIDIMKDALLIFEGAYEHKNDALGKDVVKVIRSMGYEKRRKMENGIRAHKWYFVSEEDKKAKHAFNKVDKEMELKKLLTLNH